MLGRDQFPSLNNHNNDNNNNELEALYKVMTARPLDFDKNLECALRINQLHPNTSTVNADKIASALFKEGRLSKRGLMLIKILAPYCSGTLCFELLGSLYSQLKQANMMNEPEAIPALLALGKNSESEHFKEIFEEAMRELEPESQFIMVDAMAFMLRALNTKWDANQVRGSWPLIKASLTHQNPNYTTTALKFSGALAPLWTNEQITELFSVLKQQLSGTDSKLQKEVCRTISAVANRLTAVQRVDLLNLLLEKMSAGYNRSISKDKPFFTDGEVSFYDYKLDVLALAMSAEQAFCDLMEQCKEGEYKEVFNKVVLIFAENLRFEMIKKLKPEQRTWTDEERDTLFNKHKHFSPKEALQYLSSMASIWSDQQMKEIVILFQEQRKYLDPNETCQFIQALASRLSKEQMGALLPLVMGFASNDRYHHKESMLALEALAQAAAKKGWDGASFKPIFEELWSILTDGQNQMENYYYARAAEAMLPFQEESKRKSLFDSLNHPTNHTMHRYTELGLPLAIYANQDSLQQLDACSRDSVNEAMVIRFISESYQGAKQKLTPPVSTASSSATVTFNNRQT